MEGEIQREGWVKDSEIRATGKAKGGVLWETRDESLIWPDEVWAHMVVFTQSVIPGRVAVSLFLTCLLHHRLHKTDRAIEEHRGPYWWWTTIVCLCAKIRSLILGFGILPIFQNDIFHSHKHEYVLAFFFHHFKDTHLWVSVGYNESEVTQTERLNFRRILCLALLHIHT